MTAGCSNVCKFKSVGKYPKCNHMAMGAGCQNFEWLLSDQSQVIDCLYLFSPSLDIYLNLSRFTMENCI